MSLEEFIRPLLVPPGSSDTLGRRFRTWASSLEAPVARVTAYDTHLPTALLEDHYIPTPARVAAAVRATVHF